MGISIIMGEVDGKPGAWLYDRVSGNAFGPMFEDYDEADRFLSWMRDHGLEPCRLEGDGLVCTVAEYRSALVEHEGGGA